MNICTLVYRDDMCTPVKANPFKRKCEHVFPNKPMDRNGQGKFVAFSKITINIQNRSSKFSI